MSLNERSSADENLRPNWLQSFFITCSGANKEILFQCPTEYNKYSGIGATIFFTAVLASLSGGYALYTAFFDSINAEVTFKVILITSIFGLLWGFVIFNLDRYIVLSLRKEKIPTKTEISKAYTEAKRNELKSERNRLLWNQALMASPRILIALVIALTISKPIELRLFSSRIEKELSQISQEDIREFEEKFKAEVGALQSQIQALDTLKEKEKEKVYKSNPIYNELKNEEPKVQAQINVKEKEVEQKEALANKNKYLATGYRNEYNRISETYERKEYKYWAYNSVGRRALEDKDRFEKDLSGLKQTVASLGQEMEEIEDGFKKDVEKIEEKYQKLKAPVELQLASLEESYPERKAEWINKASKSADLLARMEALSRISKWFNPVWWASTVIMLLFVLLETAPVVVKLLTKRGPYEEILERVEYEHYLREQEIINQQNMRINELLAKGREASKLAGETFMKAEKQRLDHELKNNQTLLDNLAKKQAHLAELSINKWYEDELRKIEENNVAEKNPEHQSTDRIPPTITLEDKYWQKEGEVNTIFYFKGGNGNRNDFWSQKNGISDQGKWMHLNGGSEIEIDISDKKRVFQIIDLSEDALELVADDTKERFRMHKVTSPKQEEKTDF